MHGGTTNDILIMLSSPNCHVRQERKMIMSEYKPKKTPLSGMKLGLKTPHFSIKELQGDVNKKD
jgi:hypothetical protein